MIYARLNSVILVRCLTNSLKNSKKSPFRGLKAHGAAPISVSLALGQTPVFTLQTTDTGPVYRAV